MMLRVADTGNLVRDRYLREGVWHSEVVFNTKHLGDRRARKKAAKAEMERLMAESNETQRPRVYDSWTVSFAEPSVINHFTINITLKS